ncbi:MULTISPECIES: hypothetical protein [Nonomuraea]|uniref:Uncharacterized protein n=1 Tax=Nonomuraea ferruginea TaxID=46174 RepID=A0ABT4TBS8_9ACTN|nr:hypothetical protein [Nonomuraea ferruginea]MDA0646714.1 hypothetical protein [Nonomuraea ferruginea]
MRARLALAALPAFVVFLLPATACAWPGPDPGDPFTMSVDRIGCRANTVRVTLRNQTRQLTRFDLRADSATVASGSIPARKAITRTVKVRQGSSAEIEAYSVSGSAADTLIDSTRVRNDCPWGHRLPMTGPPLDLVAKLATAGGLILTGGVVWWYGSLWPRSGSPFER